jgi:hypothetical protein
MVLIPVWRGVGGGPAGGCATYASRLSTVNRGRAGCATAANSSMASDWPFVCAPTTPLHETTSAIPMMNTSKCFRMTPPLELEVD